MSLFPWRNKREEGDEPSAVERFRRELDQLFDRYLREGLSGMDRLLSPITSWGPAVDVDETDTQVIVRAELPGVAAEDIEVRVDGRTLILTGQKKEDKEEKSRGSHRVERRFGTFTRSVTLPIEVDPDKVEAEMCQGVLTVRLNKTASAQARRIEVRKVD